MKSILIAIAIIALLSYFRWEIVRTSLAPIIDIAVCAFFIVVLMIVIMLELALIVVAPIALFLGFESREWHVKIVKAFMLGKKHVDTE